MMTTLFILEDQTLEQVDIDKSEILTTKLSVRKKTLVGIECLSSDGAVYRIVDCEFLRNVRPWWIFEFFNPIVIAKVSLEKTKKFMSSDEVYKTIKASWRKHGDIWEASDEIENLKERIERNKDSTSRMLSILKDF